MSALLLQIEADRREGMLPIAIIANAGTVNTGAIDDLRALRRLCDEQQLWLHVDGAIGALLKLAPENADLVQGLESADSVALDLHKWMYLPFEAGCLLVRDAAAHRAAFATSANYMEPHARGMLSGDLSFADLGIENSRSFKALKVWLSLKTHGLKAFGALIEQNVAQAAYLAALVESDPELELLAPRATNVVCFAYRAPGATGAIQKELVVRLQKSGEFIVSGTALDTPSGSRYALRVAITNHRSSRGDFTALAQAVVSLGEELVAGRLGSPAAALSQADTSAETP